MKNDKMVEERGLIKKGQIVYIQGYFKAVVVDVKDNGDIRCIPHEGIIDKCRGEIFTYSPNLIETERRPKRKLAINYSTPRTEEIKPTTDIDEVRRRLTWAMGVQGSPVAMLGDYEIDWIMNFFEPYLKGGE